MTINATTGLLEWTPSQIGGANVVVRATDTGGLFAEQAFTITVTASTANNAPTVAITASASHITLPITSIALTGIVSDDGLPNPPGAGATTVTWSQDQGPGTAVFGNTQSAKTYLAFPVAGTYVIRLTANDGEKSAFATITVIVNPEPSVVLPPDPATIAPPIDPTVATTIYATTQFLYSGTNPIQTGVAPGTIDPKRVAVIRGQVLTREGTALPGVTITVLDHPEFGQTLSRVDGAFDLAVNGGGYLTLIYQKPGHLPVHRQIQTLWQDYAFVPDVRLVTLDPAVTVVDLATPGMQVARGSQSIDADGARRTTLLIEEGTEATMVMADGTTQPLSALTLRATEYTVGPNGSQAMPAQLPPTSGYTYAVEISADEALSVGAASITLSRPVAVYVENFLNFPVGSVVPAGYYDRTKGQWIPELNGRVIKILNINNGLAEIDTNGDKIADNSGIADSERAKLTTLYPVGQSLWRVPAHHFSPLDYNWPYGPPLNAEAPIGPEPQPENPPLREKECEESGSIIGCEPQTLGEAVPIVGTPFSLHYQTKRQPGYQAGRSFRAKLTGGSISSSLKRVELTVGVAGQQTKRIFTPTANQTVMHAWDGLDGFGRAVSGPQKATVTVSYIYNIVYYTSLSDALRSFGLVSGQATTITRKDSEIALNRTATVEVESHSLGGEPVAGWSLSAHHRWSEAGDRLLLGDGGETRADGFGAIIPTTAGNGVIGFAGDGGPATAASFSNPVSVAIGPDGSQYIADQYNHRIRKITPDGTITTVAGNGVAGFAGDGGPAREASLNQPVSVALGPEGSLYLSDFKNNRIRRVSPDGTITTVAGNGTYSSILGDGEQATAASLGFPMGIAVGPDGTLYIADTSNNRVRRVGLDGIITTVAGNGRTGFWNDGGPAKSSSLDSPYALAVGSDGSLYIADLVNQRIRRVGINGIINTVAGNGLSGFAGDGQAAIAARLNTAASIAVTNNGQLYIADAANNRIRRVGVDGIITTVAGNGAQGFSGNQQLATATSLNHPLSVATSPDGSVFIADYANQRIRQLPSRLSFQSYYVSSKDSTEVYEFDGSGRHLRTLDALTGGVLYTFDYDSQNRLIWVTDGYANRTVINRDSAGRPLSIVSPYGQRTLLTLDAKGYLATITNPAGETYKMDYIDGLLTRFENPSGKVAAMTYDPLGRLSLDVDPAGGSKTLLRENLTVGELANYKVTVTTAEGVARAYQVEDLSTGDQRRTFTAADGTQTVRLTGSANGLTNTTLPEGTTISLGRGPDPRFGMQSPILNQATLNSSGLTMSLTGVRTAVLSDPGNPLSLTKLTDTVTLNGRSTTTLYDAASRTATTTTPAARQRITALDFKGRLIKVHVPSLAPVTVDYDERGRLRSLSQSDGTDTRTVNVSYNPQGYLETVTGPLNHTVSYHYDGAGRVTQQTLPDSRLIHYDYDPNGNLTSLTPPGRSAHVFSYTPVNLTEQYTPPAAGLATPQTHYAYNRDRQLTHITRPDGQTVRLQYNATTGRLEALTTPTATSSYAYNAVGQLARITVPEGGLNYSYNGALLTQTAWTGSVTGTTGYTYDNDFRLSSLSVNGSNPIPYHYDPDSLLIQAGTLTLSRNAQNGLLTGTTLGNVSDTLTRNAFGEVTSYTANVNGVPLYTTTYTRDALGRITQKQETIQGVSHTEEYAYDTADRLENVKRDNVTLVTYGYDANGNRTQRDGATIATVDDQDRLVTQEGTSFTYTANGELATQTQGTQTTVYSYSVLGNLQKVTLANGTVIEYLTDGQHRRIGKKVNGTLVQGFLYQDGLRPMPNSIATIRSSAVSSTLTKVMCRHTSLRTASPTAF